MQARRLCAVRHDRLDASVVPLPFVRRMVAYETKIGERRIGGYRLVGSLDT